MAGEGLTEENEMRAAGFQEDEIETWKRDTQQEMMDSGFSVKEVDEYFGVKEMDPAPLKKVFNENLKGLNQQEEKGAPVEPLASPSSDPTAIPGTTELNDVKKSPVAAKSFIEAFEAGWQTSVTGLFINGKVPETVLPEHAPMFYNIASGIGTVAGDIPAMIAGSLAGAPIGAAGGPLGMAVTGAAASFALPTAIRETLMDSYEKGEFKSFSDFWERASQIFIETSKGAVIGAATGGVGGALGKVITPAVSPLVKGTAVTGSEIATMVSVGKAIEGEMPNPEDFIEAGILVGAMHGAAKGAGKLRSIYGKTGLKPEQVAQDAMIDPVIKQELLSENIQVPKAYEKMVEGPKQEVIELKPEPVKTEPAPKTELQTAQEKVLSQIGEKAEKVSEPYTAKDFYKDYIDKLDPINQVQKITEKTTGPIEAKDNGYILSRMANDAPAKVKHVFEKGTLDFESLAVNGKGFTEIIEPVKSDLQAFKSYIVSKRSMEIEARGIKSGIDQESANTVVKAGDAKYASIAKELVEFQNRNLEYLNRSGRISKDSYEAMVEAGENYIPFKRIVDPSDPGAFSKASVLKELKGSELKIQDPFMSMLENSQVIFEMAEKNRATRAIVDSAFKVKDQTLLEKVDAANNRKLRANEFEVYRDGKREIYKAEKNVAEAIKSLDGDVAATNVFMKLAKSISTVKKLGIALTPDFIARNFFRDQITRGVFTKGETAGFVDIVKAIGDRFQKNDTYYNWLKSGGAQGTFLEFGNKYLNENIFKLEKETGFRETAFNVVKKPLDFMRLAGELVEQGTRLAEFKAVTKGATQGSKIFEGGFASREVTIDFSRMGAKLSAYNSITAFMNVSIQGLDRTVRALKEDPKGVAIKAAAYITTPSILLWWANKDDQRVQDLPRWQKDMFWIIPTDNWQTAQPGEAENLPDYLIRKNSSGGIEINKGTIYRLPKPQELGILFGSIPERMLEQFFTDNPRAFKDFEETVQNLITPSFVPDAVSPAIEQYFNKSLFTGGPIIPGHLEGLLPEAQYTEYTSETSKELSKMMVALVPPMNKPGSLASPPVLDNYIRSWGGSLGQYAIQLADKALTKSGLVPDPVKPDATLSDIPFVKSFVVRYPSAGAQSIMDFNDKFREVQPIMDTIKAYAKDSNPRMEELITENQDKLVDLNGIKTAMNNMNKQIRLIYKNPEITSTEKRQLIDGLYYGMIETAKAGNQIADEFAKATQEALKQGGSNDNQ